MCSPFSRIYNGELRNERFFVFPKCSLGILLFSQHFHWIYSLPIASHLVYSYPRTFLIITRSRWHHLLRNSLFLQVQMLLFPIHSSSLWLCWSTLLQLAFDWEHGWQFSCKHWQPFWSWSGTSSVHVSQSPVLPHPLPPVIHPLLT